MVFAVKVAKKRWNSVADTRMAGEGDSVDGSGISSPWAVGRIPEAGGRRGVRETSRGHRRCRRRGQNGKHWTKDQNKSIR